MVRKNGQSFDIGRIASVKSARRTASQAHSFFPTSPVIQSRATTRRVSIVLISYIASIGRKIQTLCKKGPLASEALTSNEKQPDTLLLWCRHCDFNERIPLFNWRLNQSVSGKRQLSFVRARGRFAPPHRHAPIKAGSQHLSTKNCVQNKIYSEEGNPESPTRQKLRAYAKTRRADRTHRWRR